jgi:hypothetical protein
MIDVDLLQVQTLVKIRKRFEEEEIFDVVRKKWLTLQPEEWVRQLIVLYLSHILNYPLNHFSLEKALHIGLKKGRWDVVIFDYEMKPFMLIECKSPKVVLSENVIYQASIYNRDLKAPFICLTNGVNSCCMQVNLSNPNLTFLSHFPAYPTNHI